jgi:short-subunit dehydrogenase
VTVTAVCPGFVHTNFHERLGLPPGQEGIPDAMWLNAPDVVREALRDAARGKAVSIPSLRYRLLVGLTRLVPASIVVKAGETGR